MTLSLNEVEAMVRKAARGAGYDWGMAEEAGRAVRVLVAFGLDGIGAFATLLRDGAGGESCPLALGTRMSDLPADAARLSGTEVIAPMLVLGFLPSAARSGPLSLRWPEGGAWSDGVCLNLIQNSRFPARARLTVAPGAIDAMPLAGASRAEPDPADWDVVTHFAQRTYAPATDLSRELGAGSGASDND